MVICLLREKGATLLKNLRTLLGGFVAVLLTVGISAPAYAQLTTTITVKNESTYTMNFSLHGSTIGATFAGTVTPTPTSIAPGESQTFIMISTYPDITAAHFFYEDDSPSVMEGCHFGTSYTTVGSYTDSAASSGYNSIRGCSAKLTIIDFITHNYSVLFTIQ